MLEDIQAFSHDGCPGWNDTGHTIIQTLEIPVERIVVRKESLIDQILRYFKRSIIWVIILLAIAIAAGIAWKIAWKFIKPF